VGFLAAWDVHRAKVFGRCEATTGIAPLERAPRQARRQGSLGHCAVTIDTSP
jgi:hypothetical protein